MVRHTFLLESSNLRFIVSDFLIDIITLFSVSIPIVIIPIQCRFHFLIVIVVLLFCIESQIEELLHFLLLRLWTIKVLTVPTPPNLQRDEETVFEELAPTS